MGELHRKLMRLRLIPLWIAWPLFFLGLIFLFAFPLFGIDWYGYGLAVALAVAHGGEATPSP